MQTILILGAGLSASSLIRYLLQNAEANHWHVRIVDQDISVVKRKIGDSLHATALSFNALISEERIPEIEKADLVISMLPARFHVEVAKDCLKLKKHLITPSYVSDEMRELDQAVKAAGLTFLNEIGVDPGIDHMSAMKIIHEIKEKGGEITSFKSFCGGLIAPESDNNPWHYKFTWNPRNVVLAGQGGLASFKKKKEYKYIPYHQLFKRIDHIHIDGFGAFEGYPNRDSLAYQSVYGLEQIETLYRGTLRRPYFCEAWSVFIELGMTDNNLKIANSHELTPRSFLNAFLQYHPTHKIEEKFKHFLGEENQHLYEHFEFLGFFDHQLIGIPENLTSAEILEALLVRKLVLNPNDKDMLVMHHEFEYLLDGKFYALKSSMVNIGEDQTFTSMSNTVGLPMAIAAKMLLNGEIKVKGVILPIYKEIYEPILEELNAYHISFKESVELIN